MNRVLDSLLVELEASGLKPGTAPFEKEFRDRKVQLCREAKSVASCWDCNYFDHCELVKAHLRDLYKVDHGKKGGAGGGSPSTPA